jgi:hypothetical protein
VPYERFQIGASTGLTFGRGSGVAILGIQPTLRALADVDKKLAAELRRELYKAVTPVAAKAKDLVPEPALSGWTVSDWPREGVKWDALKVRKGIGVAVRTTRRQKFIVSNWIGIVNKDAAGAIYELAGRRNPNNPLDRALQNKSLGKASRLVWRAWDLMGNAAQREIERELDRAITRIESEANRKLRAAG